MAIGVSLNKAPDREFCERVERCVATMVYYHRDGGSWEASGFLAEEARQLSTWFSSSTRSAETRQAIIEALKGELANRFGDDVGRRVHGEFVRALNDAESAEQDDRDSDPVAAYRAQRALSRR